MRTPRMIILTTLTALTSVSWMASMTPSGSWPLERAAFASEVADSERVEADQKAHASYARGEAAFKAEHYQQALTEFEAGYASSPRPGFLLNIGHTWRKLGDLHRARATYRKYLLVEPNSQIGDDVRSLIAEIDAALADDEGPAPRRPTTKGIGAADVSGASTPGTFTGTLSSPSAVGGPAVLVGRDGSDGVLGATTRATPVYRRPWFWVAVGAVAIGAAVGFFALQSSSGDGFHAAGNLGALGSR